jgi:hypothetical protein
MQQPFGSTLNLKLGPARTYLSLGPGWAAIAGVLSTGWGELSFSGGLQLLVLWLLVDALLGSLWALAVEQGIWRTLGQPQPATTPRSGFYLPYVQANSLGGRWVLWLRRYSHWWQNSYWPEHGDQVMTFCLGSGLAILVGFALGSTLGQLTLLAIGLTWLAGLTRPDLAAPEGGRLQALAQFLLPWVMGATLWRPLSPLSLILAICYWLTYLGGLRMLGQHLRAEWLYWLGQLAALLLCLALRQLPGAAILGVLLLAQRLHAIQDQPTPNFLAKVQPYLILTVLVAAWSVGNLLK